VLYKPSPTLALAAAMDRGLTVFDGIDLLVEQALDQISLFTKKSFDYDELRPYLLNIARAACG
jgi:shikimate 5-dehydrogenase